MTYHDVIVQKPWGYEYLCYQNEVLAIWFLFIKHGERTSLHCHPNKNTGLVILEGEVTLSFLRNSICMHSLDKIHIFRSRFHSTLATSSPGAFLLEIETPENKHDLVRLEDNYGRQGKAYEGSAHEITKSNNCIWIQDPDDKDFTCRTNGCFLRHFKADCSEKLVGFSEMDFFVLTRGGLEAGNGSPILWPGDVIDGASLERFSNAFTLIAGTTMLHISSSICNDETRSTL